MKTDTYYGERNGKVIFIKGPIELESVEPFMKLQKIKKILGLPTLNYEIVFLKPDLFGKTPLGRRNSLDQTKEYPFITSDVLFDDKADEIPYRLHSSKLWPETRLVDFDRIKGMKHLDESQLKNKETLNEYVRTIIFRYVMGLGDLAPRNFIIKNNRVYSIDEDLIDKDFNLEVNLKRIKGTYTIVVEEIKKNRHKYIDELKKYKHIELTEGGKKRLKEIGRYIESI